MHISPLAHDGAHQNVLAASRQKFFGGVDSAIKFRDELVELESGEVAPVGPVRTEMKYKKTSNAQLYQTGGVDDQQAAQFNNPMAAIAGNAKKHADKAGRENMHSRLLESDESLRKKKALGMLLLYVAFTFPALKVMFDFKDGDFSFVDGCYLAIVTMTTVGYGDITPETSAQRSFFMVYVICGIVVVGDALGIVAQFVLEEQEKLRKAAQEKVAHQLKASLEGAELEEKRPGMIKFILEHPLCICDDVVLAIWQKVRVSKQWAYFKLGIPVFIFLLLGLIMCELEDWSPHDGLYFSVITLLTIGYGDVTPVSWEGRLFAVFYLPLGVITATNMLANIATLKVELEHKRAEKNAEDTLRNLLDVLESCQEEGQEVTLGPHHLEEFFNRPDIDETKVMAAFPQITTVHQLAKQLIEDVDQLRGDGGLHPALDLAQELGHTYLGSKPKFVRVHSEQGVGMDQFIIHTLLQLDKLDEHLLAVLESQFHALDATENGTLDEDDVLELRNKFMGGVHNAIKLRTGVSEGQLPVPALAVARSAVVLEAPAAESGQPPTNPAVQKRLGPPSSSAFSMGRSAPRRPSNKIAPSVLGSSDNNGEGSSDGYESYTEDEAEAAGTAKLSVNHSHAKHSHLLRHISEQHSGNHYYPRAHPEHRRRASVVPVLSPSEATAEQASSAVRKLLRGQPEMCVVPLATLRASGRLPRADARAAVPLRRIDRPLSLVVYVSYCWRSSKSPDDSRQRTWKLVVEGLVRLQRRLPAGMHVYAWIDTACLALPADRHIARDESAARGCSLRDETRRQALKQLPSIMAQCDCVLTPVSDPDWRQREASAEAGGPDGFEPSPSAGSLKLAPLSAATPSLAAMHLGKQAPGVLTGTGDSMLSLADTLGGGTLGGGGRREGADLWKSYPAPAWGKYLADGWCRLEVQACALLPSLPESQMVCRPAGVGVGSSRGGGGDGSEDDDAGAYQHLADGSPLMKGFFQVLGRVARGGAGGADAMAGVWRTDRPHLVFGTREMEGDDEEPAQQAEQPQCDEVGLEPQHIHVPAIPIALKRPAVEGRLSRLQPAGGSWGGAEMGEELRELARLTMEQLKPLQEACREAVRAVGFQAAGSSARPAAAGGMAGMAGSLNKSSSRALAASENKGKGGAIADGMGTKVWRNGDVYHGEWRGGERHGKGVMQYASGACYDGHWQRGRRGGWGALHFGGSRLGEAYFGAFREGEVHGFGTYFWQDGDR
jgi:voltage-gated potassium channel Kch